MFLWIALAVTAYLLWRIILWLFPSKIVDLNELPRWAVVTGATDGIGQAFTHELAAKGFNIVLVSRSQEKLKANAKEIEEKFGVSTTVLQMDFTSLDEFAYGRLRSELKDIDVGVLVNNVGTDGGHPELFIELENHHSDVFRDIINVNIVSAVNMTRFVLPGMVRRGKGLIINVSSGFAQFPAPMLVLYGATKSFLKKFSEDLNLEVQSKGVHVHVLTTGLVSTKLSGVKNTSFTCPSPATYVASALENATLRVSCDGYLGHTVTSTLGKFLEMLIPGSTGKIVLWMFSSKRDKLVSKCAKCRSSD